MRSESEAPDRACDARWGEVSQGIRPPLPASPATVTRADWAEALLAASPVHIYGHDREGRFVHICEAAARMLGRTPDEVVGRTWRELGMPAEILEPFHRLREQALRSGEPVRGETTYPSAQGDRDFAFTISPIRDAEGAVVATLTTATDVTELRRTDEALRESEARFRALVEHAAIGKALVDLDGRFRHVNPALCRITGYTREELLGLSFQEITHPDDLDADIAQLRRLERGEVPSYRTEKRYFHKDGRVLWVLLTASVVRDGSGRPLYYIAQLQDFTERKAAEDAQRRLTAILEATPDVVVTADPRGQILSVNRAGRERFAGGRALVGLHLTALHPEPAAVRLLLEAIPAALRDGVWSGETTMVDADGARFPASQVLLAHHGPSGALEYLSTVIRDLGGPKRAEARQRFLAEASRALSGSLEREEITATVAEMLVADFADYCVVDLTVDDERHFCAAHADPDRLELVERLRAWPPRGDAALGPGAVLRSGEALLVSEIGPAWLGAVAPDEAHRRTLCALGATCEIVAPVRARGGVIGTVTCARTRAQRPYAKEDLLLLEDLATRVGLAIDNAWLYEQARAAVHVRERVLRVVAHDLRNPLNAISLAARALAEELSDPAPTSERKLAAIGRATKRANRLIEDLLDLARVESGGLSIEPRAEDAWDLVDEAVRLHRIQAEDRGVRLELRAERGLPAVRADRDRILQALGNLIGNALAHVPRGGAITVGASVVDGRVRLRVEDTGPGIAPAEQARLFEPFWQGERRGRQGAGLGLAIVDAIARAHGGEPRVESRPGEGSAFSFTVPRADSDA